MLLMLEKLVVVWVVLAAMAGVMGGLRARRQQFRVRATEGTGDGWRGMAKQRRMQGGK